MVSHVNDNQDHAQTILQHPSLYERPVAAGKHQAFLLNSQLDETDRRGPTTALASSWAQSEEEMFAYSNQGQRSRKVVTNEYLIPPAPFNSGFP